MSPSRKVTEPVVGGKSAPDVAVPEAVEKVTVSGPFDPLVRVTVSVAGDPSLVEPVALLNCTVPGSKSVMVTTALDGATVVAPLVGPLSATLNVSLPSTRLSSRIGTLNVALVCPAMKFSVPLVAV